MDSEANKKALNAYYAAKSYVKTARGWTEKAEAKEELKRATAACKALGIVIASPKKNTDYRRVSMR